MLSCTWMLWGQSSELWEKTRELATAMLLRQEEAPGSFEDAVAPVQVQSMTSWVMRIHLYHMSMHTYNSQRVAE